MNLPHPRFLIFLAVFVAVAALALLATGVANALILGFDLAAAVFVLITVPLWMADDLDAIRARSQRDDGGRILLLLVSGILLAIVMLALGQVVAGRSALGARDVATVVLTLLLAWSFANLVFAFHYAHIYYDPAASAEAGGLAFPGDGKPVFIDFVYFSFVIGMTCQVSDVAITSRRMRRIAVLHGLFAFAFNLGVLALIVNVLAGVV